MRETHPARPGAREEARPLRGQTPLGGLAPVALAGALWLVGVLGLTAPGCGRHRPKVVGWPRETPLGSADAEADAGLNPAAPARTGPSEGAEAAGETDAAAGAAAETDAAAGAAAETDTRAEAAEAPATGCQGLLDTACDLLGRFSQECAEARAATPRHLPDDLNARCDEELARFRERYKGEVPPSACRHLADLVCQGPGAGTETCEEARIRAKVLRKPYLRRACLGDLLLWRARRVLPSRLR